MHKRMRRPPVTVTSATRVETNCIFYRRYRLTIRQKLLRTIVAGNEGPAEDYEDVNVLAARLEEALLDPHPRPHTDSARIWLRYSFHVADYFSNERIAPIQSSLLERVSHGRLDHAGCRSVWEDSLECNIRKSYNRYVKTAALDFILTDGSTMTWNSKRDRKLLVASTGCPRPTDRHRPMLAVQRSLGRKLCIHHFYGRKFVALWYKFIRPIEWHKCDRLHRDYWEIGELKQCWEREIARAENELVEGWQTIIKSVVKYAQRKKIVLPSDGNVQLICRTLDTLIGLLLLQWRQESMTNFGIWLTNRQDVKRQLVFVIHVTMSEGQLKFDPPVHDISESWGQFCDLLSVSAYRSLQSSVVVFELIKQQIVMADQSQQEHIPHIKTKTPSEFLDHMRGIIADAFGDDEAALHAALDKFLVFSSLLKEDSVDLESLDRKDVAFEVLQERVVHYLQVLKRIETDLPRALSVGRRYLVQMGGLKSVLKNKIASIIDRLLGRFSRNFTTSATKICQDYAQFADLALTVPQTTAQWIRTRDSVSELVAATLPTADEQIMKILRCYLFMCDQMKVNESHSSLAREVIMWKRRMNASQVEHGRLLKRKRSELEEALKSKRGKVVENVAVYNNIMDSFQKMGDIESLSHYVIQARSLLFRLEEAINNVRGINEEEVYFEWEVTQYPTLAQVRERLTPFLNFFEMSSSFLNQQQQWLDSRLGSFDPETIVRETENFAQSLSTVEEQLPDISDIRHLLGQVETKLRDFNKVLPLIRTLGNPALRERHWEQIWDTVGVRLSSEAATSLQQLLALQLNEHLKKIEVISHSATQEMSLENSLLRMKNQWTQVLLPVENYRVGEGKVLGKVDSIQLLVEDHMMETQIMRRSPYVKPFEKDAKEWEQQLNDLQVLLEHCVFIQERWCSLEPLLTSPDVLSIAPEEARKFSAIDKNWRDVLGLIGQCKQVFSLLYAERMTERLNVCIQQIQQLEKNLQNLMENKRLQYPRFFLLAEDELKRLLSLSRDPHKFATCLWRLYEGVHNLEFTAENDVTHVVSATGERLALKEPVSYAKCKGQLDKFLNQLECVLKQTLNQVITETLKDFDGTDLRPILSAPSQIAILAAQVYCTNKIDAAFEAGRLGEDLPAKLDLFLCGLQKHLDATGDAVHRLTAESVTLVALYYRDLLCDLRKARDTAAAVLAWEASLKFRWIDNRIQIHVLDMSLEYGMEYVGLPPRMISYADAKRTGLTVTNALSHHLAGILVGEPRSELLESLSHCLGQRLVRFECSERVAAQDILRQIRGATTCGIWLCYHRLDALQRPAISFMTSLLVQLQNMASTTPPWLELAESALPQYGIFCLTESARYHQQFFDCNLKRTTNLSLPDVDALAQILFPGPWAVVVSFLDHARTEDEDDHQSSAIETLKQIFRVSRKSSVGAALNSWQSARLPAEQAAASTRKLTQMMPGERLPVADWTSDPVVAACPSACQKLRLHFSEQIKWKLYNLSEAFQHAKLPVLLYGPRLTGKSSLLHILVESLKTAKPQRPVVMERICVGAYTEEALMDNVSQSIIPKLVQRSPSDRDLLVVLYGPWMDGVQDVLLDALSTEGRGILSLPSTEQMTLPEHVHWVFEMGGIENVSPGHVAQCRLIPLDGQSHLTWKCLFQSWLATLPPVLTFLDPLLALLLPAVLQHVESLDEWAKAASGYHPIKAVKHLLSLVRYLTDPSAEALAKKQATLDTDMRTQLQSCVIFSILWTLAVPAYMHDKADFNQFFHDQMDFAVANGHLFPSAKPPADGSVFDFKLLVPPHPDGPKGVLWQLWGEELKYLPSLSREIPVDELFIATAESMRTHHLMSLFIQCAIPCVLVGPKASGKTAAARHYLRTRLNRATHQVIIVNASKFLDARTAQKVLMGQMERRRKSVYGPTLGKKAVIFFDDMQAETLNWRTANRVDMLLRQCIQHGQVFDGLEGGASNLIDIDFVATTRVWESEKPEGDDEEDGQDRRDRRTPDQVLQMFAPIITEPVNLETASNILYRMLMWHLDARGFAKEFDAVIDQMINASMGIYRLLIECPTMAAYPPTSGCRWNLRDLMRCIHGLLLSVPETIEDVGAMKRLWLHEACRAYSDPLSDLEPTLLVTQYVEQSCETHFQATVNDLFAQMDMVELADLADMNIDTIFFCDFSDPKSESRSYVEVMDMEHLTRVVNGYVTEYNNMNKRPMHYITVFRHLMRTMTKASRVLKQPSGHLILVGPKGVGRHTLARLAGHASDCTVHQYETGASGSGWNAADWTGALKSALIAAADDDKRSVFICSDVEFERAQCKSLVNHIASHGDLMYLFDAKERNEIVEQMRAIDLQKEKTLQTDGSPAALKAMFESRMWEQIRLVIILSCEQYNAILLNDCPQVASACQTVWIHPWPADAIADVATNCFGDIELDADQKSWLMAVIKVVQQSMDKRRVGEQCQKYGLMMDFLQVSVCLTRNFKQEFKCRQELCCQAVDKLGIAAKRVAEMERIAQQWKDNLSGLKVQQDAGGDNVVRTERDVELISCQIDRARDLLASLSAYQERWAQQMVRLEDQIRCCQSDCSLTAAALVYGAEMKESERVDTFRNWVEKCRALNPAEAVITVADDYLTLVQPEVREVEAAWIMANLARDGHCVRSAVSLRHIQRVPLLVDPHNIVEKWIDALNANKENRPTYLHMAAPDYLEQLAGALQLGTVVVIDITQTKLDPAIIPLILKQTFSQGSTNFIKLGTDVVEYASEFQLYLRTQTPVTDVDLQLRLCVTAVDLTLEYPGIYDTLVSALVNSERPDTEEKIQLCKQMAEIRCQLDETEQSLLNILSQSDQDWIENDAVITSLLPAITQSKLLKEKLDVLLQTRERMEIQRQSFAPTAMLAVQILSALWRMETLFRRLRFPLSVFADSVVVCLEDGDGDADDFDSSTSSARKLAARLFNRKLKPGMDRIQRLLAALLLSVCVARSEKLCQHSFIQLLASGRLDSSTNTKTKSMEDEALVPDPNWVEWVAQVQDEENRWQFASSVETLSHKYLKMNHKVEFADYVASLADVGSVTPILMFVEPGVDLLSVVSRLCREFDFPEDRVRFAAVAGLDSLNWVEVEDCVKRGNWLVLQGFAHLGSIINNVRVLLEHLAADNISAEFKLFVLWDALDDDDDDGVTSKQALPRLLMENCRSVYIEHVCSIEDCFQEFIRSTEFDKLMNDPLRACISYPLKVKTAAMLLVLRMVLWDRWDCLIPLSEIWQTAKQIGSLISSKSHDWAATFHQVTAGNLDEHVPPAFREEFVHNFLPDLANGNRPEWQRAVDQLLETWSSNLSHPSFDYPFICECLVDPINERRRETLLSERLWQQLVRGFAQSGPSDSFDFLMSVDEEDDQS